MSFTLKPEEIAKELQDLYKKVYLFMLSEGTTVFEADHAARRAVVGYHTFITSYIEDLADKDLVQDIPEEDIPFMDVSSSDPKIIS